MRRKPLLTQAPGDAGLVQVVGGHLHLHSIPHRQPHPTFAHLATDGGEHEMLIGQFHTEHGAWKHTLNATFNLNMLFFH